MDLVNGQEALRRLKQFVLAAASHPALVHHFSQFIYCVEDPDYTDDSTVDYTSNKAHPIVTPTSLAQHILMARV